jgi:hypothetical protein
VPGLVEAATSQRCCDASREAAAVQVVL